jgi:hypothetical protein
MRRLLGILLVFGLLAIGAFCVLRQFMPTRQIDPMEVHRRSLDD